MQIAATATPPPRRGELVRGVADDPSAGRAERVADRDRAAVDVDPLGVELGPQLQAREALRGEGLVELDEVDVRPGAPGTGERPVGGLDGGDPEDVRVVAEHTATGDPGEGLGIQRALPPEQHGRGAVVDRATRCPP